MAYLIFTINGEEIDRLVLGGPVVIGRAPDCGYCVHDIMMSRKHCRIEPQNGQWVIADLASKNGIHLAGHRIQQHALKDGDELRMGRTRVTFKAGTFVPSAAGKRQPAVQRPIDPHEALAGTMSGFELVEPGEVERQGSVQGMPYPQPRPLEPKAYQTDDVYGMINELASSSWDSIWAGASRPVKMEKVARQALVGQPPIRRGKGRVSFALQARARAEEKAGWKARWLRLTRLERRSVAVLLSFGITMVVLAAWLAIALNGPRAAAGQSGDAPAAVKLQEREKASPPAMKTAAPQTPKPLPPLSLVVRAGLYGLMF